MRFTGHERDEDPEGHGNDLDYMHARYYSPRMGRFLSLDRILGTVRSPQSWNRYAYVHGNPMVMLDPDGLTGRHESYHNYHADEILSAESPEQRDAAIADYRSQNAASAAVASVFLPGPEDAAIAGFVATKVGGRLASAASGALGRLSGSIGRGLGRLFGKADGAADAVPRGTTGAESALQNERLRASLSAQELAAAPRVGSGLKPDSSHRAASFVVDDVAQSGRVFNLRGGDGVQRTLTQVDGAVNGQRGVFEWIVDPSGNVTHQRFISGGRITGSPNQVP